MVTRFIHGARSDLSGISELVELNLTDEIAMKPEVDIAKELGLDSEEEEELTPPVTQPETEEVAPVLIKPDPAPVIEKVYPPLLD